ncbi:esterase [Iodidimonas muriae]|uniref:Esterase n=1 Tax=Iodidimonas muriae TaxID=261467 RepID=A0ABQ2LF08_9PROT|nr:polyhydroxyalkanoate depolymerase [Iodidimonas muriae]GER07447.1 esterase [Kordiimonadales bacterium JCM 17843]GGO14439.1 esterase [Iodidimonas muriae]
MLYSLYELQHTAVAPLRFAADNGQIFFRNPYNPLSYTPAGRVASAALDLFEHTTRRYGKPRFDLDWTEIDGRKVKISEETMFRRPFGQLRRFTRDARRPDDPKLLLVAPMSGHFATLLRGTVEALLPDHDVYITDWRDARDIPVFEGRFDLDDYIDYVIGWLEDLGSNCHVMAVCQPAVPVYAAIARMEAEGNRAAPLSMTLMGGPIDTRANPTAVNDLATTRPLSWFERNVITHVPPPNAGMWRKVYPGFLQLAGFMSMNLGDHVMKHHEFFNHLVEGDGENAEATRSFYEEYRSVMDMTAEFYLQTIETVFQTHALPKGEMMHRDQPVDPSAIKKTAILCVEGERDDISGIGQTKAALTLATNLDPARKSYFMAPKVGHYGIFNGRRWREVIAPKVRDFIRLHDRSTR